MRFRTIVCAHLIAAAGLASACAGAFQGATFDPTYRPTYQSPVTVTTTDGQTAVNLTITVRPDTGAPFTCPPARVNFAWCVTQLTGGAFADISAEGYQSPAPVRFVIGEPIAVTLEPVPPPIPPLPPPPTRWQLLTMQTGMYGLRCHVPSLGGDIPWFDPGIQAISNPDEEAAIFACKKARGDTGIITGPGLIAQVLYDEPNNPYQVPIPTFDIAAKVDHYVRNGLWADLYLDGDAFGPDVAMQQFPVIYRKLLQGGPPQGPNDLNQYVNFRPAWDGWFYGVDIDKILAWARMARTVCPYCVITFEFNTGHIPFGEGNADFLPGGRMQDFDGVKVEFSVDTVHDDNTWQILARLLGPAYHKPADDPNGAAPWYLASPSPRGPWGVECFEPPTYAWVRERKSQQQADDDRAYLTAIGCPAVD